MKENKPEDFLIEIEERYGDVCFQDGINVSGSKKRNPQGFVKIFEVDEDNKKQLVGKSNLVVYLGRETLAQLLTNINNSNIVQDRNER